MTVNLRPDGFPKGTMPVKKTYQKPAIPILNWEQRIYLPAILELELLIKNPSGCVLHWLAKQDMLFSRLAWVVEYLF